MMRCILILLLLCLPLAMAVEPALDDIEVKIHFPVEKRTIVSTEEFNITGYVIYANPYRKDLSIGLYSEAEHWNVSIDPDHINVSDEKGTVEFMVHVVPGKNRTDTIVVYGEWRTESGTGDAIPDMFEAILVETPQHDSGPSDIRVLIITTMITFGAAISAGYGMKKVIRWVPPFYTRLDRDAVREQRSRKMILAEIERSPGLCLKELVERTGEARSTLMYHLRVLERERMVYTVRDGRRKRIFPGPRRPMELEDTILEIVARHPGIDISSIARKLGKSRQTIAYHVSKMAVEGRIWTERTGRRKRCYPRP